MQERIIIKNDQGEEKEFDILFTFTSNDTGKDYITYTDYSKDENGNINCYSVYKEGDKLLPVTTEKELTFIDETLKTIQTYLKEKGTNN